MSESFHATLDGQIPPFPTGGQGLEILFEDSTLTKVGSTLHDVSGVFLGPDGKVIFSINGRGYALRFGSASDCMRLVLGLLSLAMHMDAAARAALDQLDQIIRERATVGGHGHA